MKDDDSSTIFLHGTLQLLSPTPFTFHSTTGWIRRTVGRRLGFGTITDRIRSMNTSRTRDRQTSDKLDAVWTFRRYFIRLNTPATRRELNSCSWKDEWDVSARRRDTSEQGRNYFSRVSYQHSLAGMIVVEPAAWNNNLLTKQNLNTLLNYCLQFLFTSWRHIRFVKIFGGVLSYTLFPIDNENIHKISKRGKHHFVNVC